MVRFLFIIAMIFLPSFAMAQNAPSAGAAAQAEAAAPKFAPLKLQLYPDSTIITGPDDPKAVTTQKDFINAYAQNCMSSNSNKALQEYKELQCACTAAEMSQTMKAEDLAKMFQDSSEGNFEYARMMLLSYIPCMSQTVKKFIFDSCISDKNMQTRFKNEASICSCVSENMGTYIAEDGSNIIPGFVRSGFKKSEAVNDTLGYVITSPAFQLKSGHFMRTCIKAKER